MKVVVTWLSLFLMCLECLQTPILGLISAARKSILIHPFRLILLFNTTVEQVHEHKLLK